MEYFLIGAMVVLIVLQFWEKKVADLLETFSKNPHGLTKYLGASATLTVVVLGLPDLLITIYMRSHGFYSWELFSVEVRSFDVLSLNVFINLIVLSFLTLSFFLFLKGKFDRSGKFIVLACNAAYLLIVVYIFRADGRYATLEATMAFCGMVIIYTFFLTGFSFEDKARRWMVPLIFSALLISAPLIWQTQASLFAESALHQMRAGGMEVQIRELDGPSGLASCMSSSFSNEWLILRTPEFVYFAEEEHSNKIHILPSDRVEIQYDTGKGLNNAS